MKALSCGPKLKSIKRFREFQTPFCPRNIHENPRACAAGDGAICCNNRKSVPYHGANPNIRNGVRSRFPSPIMAPGSLLYGIRVMLVRIVCFLLKRTSGHLNSKGFLRVFQLMTRASQKEQATTSTAVK